MWPFGVADIAETDARYSEGGGLTAQLFRDRGQPRFLAVKGDSKWLKEKNPTAGFKVTDLSYCEGKKPSVIDLDIQGKFLNSPRRCR